MAHKELKYDAEARAALQGGVDAVANAVKVTLGPKGRYVVLDKKFGAPTITNDGVTIAREIEIEDVFAEPGRSAGPRGRHGDQRRRRRRDDDRDPAGPDDRPPRAQERRRRRQPAGPAPRDRDRGRPGRRSPAQQAVEGGRWQGADRPRRRHLGRRRGDRQRDRRRDREGRQGRRRQRRRGPDLRDGARVHRGHAVRQGLHLAVHDHRPGSDGGGARGPLHPDREPEDRLGPRHPADPRADDAGRQAAGASSPRTSRASRSRPWWSTSSAAPSPASRSRRRASATAASGCSRTSRSSPVAR